MDIKKTEIKRPCDIHGDRIEVVVTTEDAMGFRHRIHVCEGCFDDAIAAYLNETACADCGVQVASGMGFELDGVFTPLCRACQGKKITTSVKSEHGS